MTEAPAAAAFSPDQIPECALAWHRAGQASGHGSGQLSGRGAALATVVETWGSAPRPAGSQLAVSAAGEMAGSVSGGCVEGAVVAEAQAAIADGRSRLLTFGVADEDAFAVGLACGGTIRVLVQPVGPDLTPEMLERLVAARAARQPAVLLTRPGDFSTRLLTGPALQDDPLADFLAERLRADRSGMIETAAGEDVFAGLHNPPLRMIVVGAVHIAQALLPMARMAGYDPVLIDPRSAFGSAARFPGETILDDWPDEAMQALAPDARTAVVTLTHDPKLDDPAILQALGAPVFYLGCLGSKRTHAKRLERLAAAGVSPGDLARIHAPVGLDIGARSPAEIAVSVLAEITARLRQG